MAGPGLYANIHAKRKRGEKMRKKGAKGAPKSSDFAAAKRTAKKAVGGVIGRVKRKVTKPKPKPAGPLPNRSYPGMKPPQKRQKPNKKKQIKSYEGYA